MFTGKFQRYGAILLLVGIILGLTGCSFRVQPSFGSGSMIRVGSVSYDTGISDLVLYTYQQIYEEDYGFGSDAFPWTKGLTAGESGWTYLRDHLVLDEFCCAAALSQMADERDIRLSEEDDGRIAQAAAEFVSKSAADASEKAVYDVLALYRLAELCIQDMTRDVSADISDEEARVIEITRLSFSQEGDADAVYQRLSRGDSIETVTGTLSEEAVCTYQLSRGEESADLEAQAFRLKTGETSPVFAEDGMWYIVYCNSDYDPDLTEQNRNAIFEDRKIQAWMPVYREWVASAGVYLDQTRWGALQPFTEVDDQINLFDLYRSIFPAD